VEEDQPGVYITIRALPGGIRELRRVRFRWVLLSDLVSFLCELRSVPALKLQDKNIVTYEVLIRWWEALLIWWLVLAAERSSARCMPGYGGRRTGRGYTNSTSEIEEEVHIEN
jgi:hypothetical protein